MLIVGLNGSSNTNGNTKFLINKVLEEAKILGAEIKIIEIGEIMEYLDKAFCNACTNPCSGICYKDTSLTEVFELMERADALVLGSPSYFGTVSGQMKAFFDKTRALRSRKALYNKVGVGVTVGASKYGGQETTLKALHDIMLVHGMILIGDGFRDDDCGHHGVCAQRPSDKDEFAIKRAQITGRRIYEVAQATMGLRV